MSAEGWAVTIYLHKSGHLRAFADVTVLTPGGELIIKGCRVMQSNGKGLWVALPSTRYSKNGETKYKDVIEMTQTSRRKLFEAILSAYDKALDSSDDLSAGPQRSDR